VPPLLQSHVPGYPCRRGKVRDVYDLGDRLVIVATDRISAFDWVLPTPIPDKGRVLTALTLFWLDRLGGPHHLLGTDLRQMDPAVAARAAELEGRSRLVRKAADVAGHAPGAAAAHPVDTGEHVGPHAHAAGSRCQDQVLRTACSPAPRGMPEPAGRV
jgi:phosphoribosylaminoimidazole-succinocarboxamide synthase